MVIGFDAKRAFQNNTGLGNYSRMLLCGLASEHQNLRAFLYSPRISGEYAKYFSGYANISTRTPSSIDRFFPDIWRRFGVTVHLSEDKVKLFHGLSHELPHGIPRSIKRVVTMHDLIVWRYPQFYKPLDRVVHRIKQRHSCRIADVVVAISEQTKSDLVGLMHVPEEKIRVVYQSCDPIFWNATFDDSARVVAKYGLPRRYVLCVGTVEERKNQMTAVRALAELPEDVGLVIVGRPRGRYPEEVRRLVAELGLGGRVVFLQNAAFGDFPALYHGAVASVYMSVFEGFGIPVLESLCCDTPVVTSDVSSMPEAGGDAALYADPTDHHGVAMHLLRLLDDDGFRRRQIEKGRIQRMKFAPDKVSEEMMAVYRSLLDD